MGFRPFDPNAGGTGGEDNAIFFQDDLIITGAESTNKFIYNGDSNVDVTLPLESSVGADYVVFIENQTTKKNRIVTILAQGSDTLLGPSTVGEGDSVTVSVTGTDEYTAVTPAATVQTDGTLGGDGSAADVLTVNRVSHSREIFVSDSAGNDAFDGMNIQTQVKTVGQAISLAMNLVPAPSANDLTTVNDFGGSEYVENVVTTGNVQYNFQQSAFFGAAIGLQVVTLGSEDRFNADFVTTFNGAGGGCVLANNIGEARLTNVDLFCIADNQSGLTVSGTSSNFATSDVTIETLGDNSKAVSFTHTGVNRHAFDFNDITVEGDNSTGVFVDIVGGDAVTVNTDLITVAATATGSKAIEVVNGFAAVSGSIIGGSVEVAAGAALIVHADAVSDAATINVDGTMWVWIVEGNPIITGTGTINGYIGGTYYGVAKPSQDYARNIFVSDSSGDDANSGLNTVTTKATMTSAIAAVNALVPAPNANNRSFINMLGAETYSEGVLTLPAGCVLQGHESTFESNAASPVFVTNAGSGIANCTINAANIEPITAVQLNGNSPILREVNMLGTARRTTLIEASLGQFYTVRGRKLTTQGDLSIVFNLDTNNFTTQEEISLERVICQGTGSTIAYIDVPATQEIRLVGENWNCPNGTGLDAIQGIITCSVQDYQSDLHVGATAEVSFTTNSFTDSNTITVDAGGVLNIWSNEGDPTIVNNGTINGYVGGVYYGDALQTDHYTIITNDYLLPTEDHAVYIDASANPVTLTLATEPNTGENKTVWIADNTNEIKIVSESPSYPLAPPTPVAEANLQGQWALNNDFLDIFSDKDF